MKQPFWADWQTPTPLARRALAAYILSVLVTCSLGTALTYGLLQQNLETDAQAHLLEDARVYGLAVFSHLENADRILTWLTSAPIQPGAETPVAQPPESPLAAVNFVRLDVPAGDIDPEDIRSRSRELAAIAEQSLGNGAPRDSTIVFAHEGSKTLPVLVRQIPGMSRFFAVGWIRPDYVWGGAGMLPEGVQLCVGGPRDVFRVCRPRDDQTGSADAPQPSALMTAHWTLFLRARFGIEDWSVEASKSRSLILAPLSGLRFGAVPLAGAVLLLTVFLGSTFIRRSFGPLERLLANWKASDGKPTAAPLKAPAELGQLSTFITSSGARLERSRRLLDALTELDRKILLAGSLEATVLWLLPRVATELNARAVAVMFAAPPEGGTGTLYVATEGSPPSFSVCDVSIQCVRKLMESEGRTPLANLEGASFASLHQQGFRANRAYPIRDEKHLVGALLLLDPPAEEVDADTDRLGLTFSDRLSVAVSHWRRKEELTRATHFDSLTGLANRELLLERIARALADSAGALAVMLIGFEGLENINTTLGHRAGDELLRLAAQRIRAVVHETETLARLTGNQLVLLIPNLDEPVSAATAAERIVALFERPFLADGLSYVVSVSIGIALSPADGLTPEGLIRSAETAMRRAKPGSAGRITFFEEVMNNHAKRRVWLEHGLRGAMGTRELQLYFQPKVELATQRVIGAEALLRWTHPTEGAISPTEFVPTAEASGLIVPIGQWALEESCRRLLEWRRAGVYLDHIAVNLSLRQLQDPSFLEHLLRYVSDMGIDPRLLELEITESMFAEQPAQISRTLEQIRSRGVRIAIDDFGTGYSSLAQLQLLPFDVLKIDRAFVSGIGSGTGDAIVKAIIAMGLALGKDLVAEGIETEAQARALEHRGCNSAQGFYFAPALPADDFIRFFHEQRKLSLKGAPGARRA